MTVKENKTPFEEEIRTIDPPDKFMTGLLAWAIPGLGHIYQQRTLKGILFFFCITPLLIAGIWMGSYWEEGLNGTGQVTRKLQIGRDIYYSWRVGDKRLYFIPQAMIGAVAVPALLQSKVVEGGNDGFCYNLFAPPRLALDTKSVQPTLDNIIQHTWSWFDLGTIFTVSAGLLNLLVIFDAVSGPAWIYPETKEEEEKE